MQEHIKKQILIRPDTHYRGYQQLGANVTRYEEGYQRDWHEAIDLYREYSPMVSSSCLPKLSSGSQLVVSPMDSQQRHSNNIFSGCHTV